MTSVPGVMPNHALPPAMNTVTMDMMTIVMHAVMTPRASDDIMRFVSRATTSRFAASKSARS